MGARAGVERSATTMRGWQSLVLLCLGAVGAVSPTAADDGRHFVLPAVSLAERDGVYHLTANADLTLTPSVREALEQGVELELRWQINIERERTWWLDGDVASVVQRNRLAYRPLTRQFVVTDLNTGERTSYERVGQALDAIASLDGFPVVDRVLVEPPNRHRGYARIDLVHSALPLPLRATAFVSSAWDLSSQWRRWRFE